MSKKVRLDANNQWVEVDDDPAGVPPERTISAGDGLTGGGDLSADRSFSVSVNGITNALLRDSAGLSVIGRSVSTFGDPADITAWANHNVLRRSGSTLSFGPIRLDQAGAVDGHLSQERGGWGLSTLDWPPGALPLRNGFGTGWTYTSGTTNGQPLVWQTFTNSAAFAALNLSTTTNTSGILPQERGGWGVNTQDWLAGSVPYIAPSGGGWSSARGTSTGQPLVWNAGFSTPMFGALNLSTTTNTSGILPEARGGTGQARGAAPSVTLTGATQNVTLNLTSNMATVLNAANPGTTNLTFTGAGTARTRISYLVCLGVSSGRVLNWPTGVTVYPPSGSSPETSYTIPAGVRTVVQLLQVRSNEFYRLTG